MDRQERVSAHQVWVPNTYRPDPLAHLNNPRDKYHFDFTEKLCQKHSLHSILDVGCWDGWLDFLLISRGYQVDGVELIPDLAKCAQVYADQHRIQFHAYTGFLDEIIITNRYDLVLCYETLEHLYPFDTYIQTMENLALKKIAISLPDQKHEDNQPQHLWTPTKSLIETLFGHKKDFELTYQDYPGTPIPSNWFITYSV